MSYTPSIQNKISTLNSFTLTPLTGGTVWQGTSENVSKYGRAGVSVYTPYGEVTSGTLWMEVSRDNVEWSTIPRIFSDTSTAQPHMWAIVEKYFRVRYVNDATTATTFQLQTQYSVNDDILLGHPLDEVPVAEHEALQVKSIGWGVNPAGVYSPQKLDGSAFSTTTPLASLAVYDSGVLDMDGYTQVQTEISADFDGTLDFTFYEDSAGANTIRSISIPYVAANGYQLYSAPSFGYYVRYKFTNTSASLQTDFFFTTKFLTKALSAQVLDKSGYIAPTMTANLIRSSNEFNTDRNVGLIGGQESKRQFGVNTSVGTALETVWSYSADWIPNQVMNEKLRIKAGGNAADAAAGLGAQTVTVNFLDENWLEIEETLITSGASASAVTTANCVRLLKVQVDNVGTYHGANTAGITLELTGGNIMGYISTDKGVSEEAIMTTPANKTIYITEIFVSVGQGDSADVKMFSVHNADDVTTPFSAKHEEWTVEDFSGAQTFKMDTHLKMDPKEDFWFEAEKITGGGSARVSVDFNYYTVVN